MGNDEGIRFDQIVHRRILCELSLVGILQQIHKDSGKRYSKKELLEDLKTLVQAEREGLKLIGRKDAGRVYGYFEGRQSSVATVDYVLGMDFIGYYRALTEAEDAPDGE